MIQNPFLWDLWHHVLPFCFPIPSTAKGSLECDNIREHLLPKSPFELGEPSLILESASFFLFLFPQILEWTRHFWPNFGPLKWRSSGVLAVNYKSEGGFSETFCSQDKASIFFSKISENFFTALVSTKNIKIKLSLTHSIPTGCLLVTNLLRNR